jgi:hypothetical protein
LTTKWESLFGKVEWIVRRPRRGFLMPLTYTYVCTGQWLRPICVKKIGNVCKHTLTPEMT